MLQAGIGRRLRKEPTDPVTRSHEVTHGLTNREERSDGSRHPLGRNDNHNTSNSTQQGNCCEPEGGCNNHCLSARWK